MLNLQTICIGLLMIGSAIALKNDKECDLKLTARRCIKTGFLLEGLNNGLKNQRFPKDKKDMDEMCSNVKAAETCVQDFITRCSDSFKEKQALDQSLEGAVRLIKRVCKTDRKKNEFINNVSKCGNDVLKDGTQCLDNYKKVLAKAVKLNDKDQILKMMCCKIHDIGPCAEKRMKEKGEAICSSANINYLHKFEEAFKEEMIAVICADYEKESKKCKGFTVDVSNETINDSSLIVAMKSIIDKVL